MSSSRSFGPVAEQMKDALQKYSKDELIDLMTHIVKTYVVEGTLPLTDAKTDRSGEEELARLSFPQLVLHLQMHLDHREFSAFSVSGNDVWVSMGNQRINLTTRQNAPAPAPVPDPTPPEQSEAQITPGGRQAFGEPTREEPPRPPDNARPEPPEDNPDFPAHDDADVSERFGMLEID